MALGQLQLLIKHKTFRVQGAEEKRKPPPLLSRHAEYANFYKHTDAFSPFILWSTTVP